MTTPMVNQRGPEPERRQIQDLSHKFVVEDGKSHHHNFHRGSRAVYFGALSGRRDYFFEFSIMLLPSKLEDSILHLPLHSILNRHRSITNVSNTSTPLPRVSMEHLFLHRQQDEDVVY